MHLIKPLHPGVIDALTGKPFDPQGNVRAVLLPADHYAQRVGDVSITPHTPAAPAAKAAAKPKAAD